MEVKQKQQFYRNKSKLSVRFETLQLSHNVLTFHHIPWKATTARIMSPNSATVVSLMQYNIEFKWHKI